MDFPNKSQYKATTTNKLRSEIADLAKRFKNPSYLEVGFDKGYNLLSINQAYSVCYGVDIDPERFKFATNLMQSNVETTKNIDLFLGTLENVEPREYNVVFIDADHVYEAVKKDWELLQKVNTANHYIVVFHDYGLVDAGVKKFIQETFSREQVKFMGEYFNWNPLGGPVNDWEAVMVEVRKDENE